MPRVLHLIDASDPQELRLALAPLLQRLSADRWTQFVAPLSGGVSHFPFASDHIVGRVPVRFGLHFLAAPALRRLVRRHRIDLIHAWSLEAAYVATLASDCTTPMAVSLWDPHLIPARAGRLHALTQRPHTGILCHAAMVERRLVERGVPIERCAVVRPGVDFGLINRLKRDAGLREQLQLDDDHIVVLLPPSPCSRAGHWAGAWAVETAARLEPRLTLLLPDTSPEREPILKYFRSVALPPRYRVAGDDYRLEQLLCVADVLLLPAEGDISTTALAWAMAAGVPILGIADYCITEFIADGQNGHLVKPAEPMLLAGKLLHVVRDSEANAPLYDRSRAQAFECFGLSRYIEQTQHAYENLLAGKPVSADLTDSAVTT
ncbi:MAG: glycosyltransferase family 4 protein [Planctomycetes bacterium]|nr:glycosyltransferase family 4 protein [Planctomycetota bacterium]